MPAEDGYEVIALRYGTLATRKRDVYYRWDAYGEPDAPTALSYYFYVVRNDERTIVVDTGFSRTSGEARGRTCEVEPADALAAVGVDPTAIHMLVLTHFHYDHIGNVGLFGSVPITAPERELRFYRSATSRQVHYAQHVDRDDVDAVLAADDAGRIVGIGDRRLLAPGVTAHWVGGHSPGQLVLHIATPAGPLVLASDAVHFYEELALERPFAVVSNLEEMYAAFTWLHELEEAGAVIVPGHDPLVVDRFPAVSGVDGVTAIQLAARA